VTTYITAVRGWCLVSTGFAMDITSTIVKGRETGASNKEKRKEKKTQK
jgi:hypothetical protein